jgi:formamidopyrimidine-DNA glycosylase
MRLSPRIAPQPSTITLKPGESKVWSLIGMDLDGLSTTELLLHFDPRTMDVTDVAFGPALAVDAKTPPAVTINREAGTIRVVSTDGKALAFTSGGEVLSLRVHGGLSGETFLVVDTPDLRDLKNQTVAAAISGGRARVE